MWPIDALFTLLVGSLALRSGLRLLGRQPQRAAPPRRVLSWAAFVLLVFTSGTCVLITLGDAGLGPWAQPKYQVLGLALGSAMMAVAAVALAIEQFAWPRAVRSSGQQTFAIVMLAVAFAIGGCYGTMMFNYR
ncbi:MAG: hypothetical protein JNN13_01970 [Planctomycetes bacterium]|nr:hypothetical protein [Planctomycetota bacterium]